MISIRSHFVSKKQNRPYEQSYPNYQHGSIYWGSKCSISLQTQLIAWTFSCLLMNTGNIFYIHFTANTLDKNFYNVNKKNFNKFNQKWSLTLIAQITVHFVAPEKVVMLGNQHIIMLFKTNYTWNITYEKNIISAKISICLFFKGFACFVLQEHISSKNEAVTTIPISVSSSIQNLYSIFIWLKFTWKLKNRDLSEIKKRWKKKSKKAGQVLN